MIKTGTSCFKVSDIKICVFCRSDKIIKNGFTKNKKQQYYCKDCRKRFIDFYTYRAYDKTLNNKIIALTKEGLGIRSTARVLTISTTTLLRRIVLIVRNISRPVISRGNTYEVDEIRAFLKRKDKLIRIVYALERESRKVVSFYIGARTNKTLNAVLKTLHFAKAKHIFTDKLKHCKYLIKKTVHKITPFGTNHIERNNLTLRTHLKRLNRRTICFSKSLLVLVCILKIYFWSF